MLKTPLLTALLWAGMMTASWGACCYFAALDKDVTQPGQRAFISFDETTHYEAFTVQPTFQGNAVEFGMVIPTPSRPKLQEMPREFFKAMAVFTILEPMDMKKFKRMAYPSANARSADGGSVTESKAQRPAVRVLEHGVVGSLDYKILEADRADALYEWLKQNKYSYSGDKKTLEYYVNTQWTFTVMKIDPRQMKKNKDGSYTGEVTPTRFTFASDTPIYPLHITQISVKDRTDALLYVMHKKKMDLPGKWSYEPNFTSMWSQAMSFAVPEMLTPTEQRFLKLLSNQPLQAFPDGAQLEWSGKLTEKRLECLSDPEKYNRDAPAEEKKRLVILRGHLKEGYYLTKLRKSFRKDEMTHDLDLVPARINGVADELDYVSILPTSPP